MDLQEYKKYIQEPWGQLYYEIVFQQLINLENQKILDFGSGFGIVSNFLAQKNQVLAVEPNQQLINERKDTYDYEQVCGSIEVLDQLPDASFDIIICHNVLEYVEDPASYLKEFARLLKVGGKVSLIKHNQVGRIMQAVVFENNIKKARALEAGQAYQTHSMGEAHLYKLEDVTQDLPLEIQDYQGIRVFYGLQINEFKTVPDWHENLLGMELAVYDQSPYRDIAAFQHLWLRKI
ncbi:class I SAM-dependent methyltransferase [Streptococcus oricebi]|uniref:Class I SAM-dependent methyltransferase n=1 Tax=Streptococcus oricebi TaxID=1547447 RepID=A0ABS5B216_9STRE|nr:class I SAM-dependent methyltransferase [Streptococcus oricebi]MBP2622556.1 class I SAM-dependent methyltransferase [Streptococcus oricebi]